MITLREENPQRQQYENFLKQYNSPQIQSELDLLRKTIVVQVVDIVVEKIEKQISDDACTAQKKKVLKGTFEFPSKKFGNEIIVKFNPSPRLFSFLTYFYSQFIIRANPNIPMYIDKSVKEDALRKLNLLKDSWDIMAPLFLSVPLVDAVAIDNDGYKHSMLKEGMTCRLRYKIIPTLYHKQLFKRTAYLTPLDFEILTRITERLEQQGAQQQNFNVNFAIDNDDIGYTWHHTQVTIKQANKEIIKKFYISNNHNAFDDEILNGCLSVTFAATIDSISNHKQK